MKKLQRNKEQTAPKQQSVDPWTATLRRSLLAWIDNGGERTRGQVYRLSLVAKVSETAIWEFADGRRATLTLPVACRLGTALGLTLASGE